MSRHRVSIVGNRLCRGTVQAASAIFQWHPLTLAASAFFPRGRAEVRARRTPLSQKSQSRSPTERRAERRRRSRRTTVAAAVGACLLFAGGVGAGLILGGISPPPSPAARPAGVTVAVGAAAVPAEPAREPARPVVVPPPPVPAPPPAPVPPRAEQPAWMRHAVPVQPRPGHPTVTVIIDDMGLDRARSQRVVALPGPLTLSYLPYSRDLAGQVAAGRAAGHEIMLHLPMEPQGGDVDPGPNALTLALSPADAASRLRTNLDAFDAYVGVNNHMGSRYTEDRPAMQAVLKEIQRRGLLFVDSRTSGRSVGLETARQLKMPAAGRDVFLDNDHAPGAIRAQLARLEAAAKRNGAAIAIGHPHDATIEALAEWLPTVAGKGFDLVPVTHVVRAGQPGG
jgi:polysaccharide deacetylase 2 family uncharacterized protein YibQ